MVPVTRFSDDRDGKIIFKSTNVLILVRSAALKKSDHGVTLALGVTPNIFEL